MKSDTENSNSVISSIDNKTVFKMRSFDHTLRSKLSQLTFGTSPAALTMMMTDWSMHLASSPDKQLELATKAQKHCLSWCNFAVNSALDTETEKPILPEKGDHRFLSQGWSKPGYAALEQAFLLTQDFWDSATTDVRGMSKSHDSALTFMTRQMLDAIAPSNFPMTNPEIVERSVKESGTNFLRGAISLKDDVEKAAAQQKPKPTKIPGRDVAATPGKVVYRNHLVELIQYDPVTEKVQAEPILIVPAWIMKYYILDLSPENSMVRYLVEQGFTVFMISWRNPDADDAELSMADYLRLGPMASIDYISKSAGAKKIHTTGYCLGGTLLSIAAAAIARDDDMRLASITLFAAQTDFSEAGELMLFINESQVAFLEDIMAEQGYLDAEQMLSAFQMMRSNDLVWSRMIRSYLLGEQSGDMNDLMSWNADGTRMPARMHSEYLRQLFLNNNLANGHYKVDGHPVFLRDIRCPIFAVGTETDHIAPWKSVFKIHDLTRSDVTFALTSGGHNAGVISEPGHKHRHFRLHTSKDKDHALPPEEWLEKSQQIDGSWWPAWIEWLTAHSSAEVPPPKIKGDFAPAPGNYVMME